jgi:hemerythrin
MTIAIWSSQFETGVDLIDSQHKALFEAVNKLETSFSLGNTDDTVKKSLDFLVKYTVEHFQTEEQFMREAGYPGLAEHLAEHSLLMTKVYALQARLAEGTPITMDVMTFFAGWLGHHIYGSDLTMVRFLKEKN